MKFARWFAEPATAFPLLALAFGLPILILYPPFQAPDEHYHFFRAYEISEGRFTSRYDEHRNLVELPLSLGQVANGYMSLPFRPDNRTSAAKILGDFKRPLDPEVRGTLPGNAALYPAVAYAPHAIGIAIGRLFGGGPLWLLYLGRLAGLLFGIAGITLALRLTGAMAHTTMLVALLPMTLTQMAALSSDVVFFVACFVLTSLILFAQFSTEKPIDRRWIAGFVGAAVVVAIIKPMYLAMTLMLLAVPPKRLGGLVRAAGIFAVAAFAGWLAYRGWTHHVGNSNVAVLSDAGTERAGRQAIYVADNELKFLWLVVTNLSRKGYWYLETFIGKPGWLDTQLAAPIVFALMTALVIVALSERPAERVPWKLRAAAVAAFAIVTVTMSYAMYLYHTPGVGDDNIEGIQGRYFLTIAPMLALALAGSPLRLEVTPQRRTQIVSAIAAAGLLAMIITMYFRYYS